MPNPRRLRIPGELAAYIQTFHPQIKRKIRATFDTLLADPHSGKPLRGPLLGLWSIRVGKFRVIYREAGGTIQIVAVGPRRTIYEEKERLARRRPA